MAFRPKTQAALDKLTSVLEFEVEIPQGFDPTSAIASMEPVVRVTPAPARVLANVLESAGASRVGHFTWVIGSEKHERAEPLQTLAAALNASPIGNQMWFPNPKKGFGLSGRYVYYAQYELSNVLRQAGFLATDWVRTAGAPNTYFPHGFPESGGMIGITGSPGKIHVRFNTVLADALDYADDLISDLNLNVNQATLPRREMKPLTVPQAAALTEHLEANGFVCFGDTDRLSAAVAAFDDTVVAVPDPDAPAQAQVAFGRKLRTSMPTAWAQTAPTTSGPPVYIRKVSSTELEAWMSTTTIATDIDPQVADVLRMESAIPVVDPALRSYQSEAVGLHLTTRYGFVNAIEPGMGKTITSLAAMARKAKTHRPYRGLVIAEANVRTQWTEEAKVWFPEAKVVTVRGTHDTVHLIEALSYPGPVVAITSYAMVRTIDDLEPAVVVRDAFVGINGQGTLFGFEDEPAKTTVASPEASVAELLMTTEWDDLIADEANGLRNTASKQTRSLWKLRKKSQAAVVLTGTPITRDGLDDLGHLLKFARGDKRLFSGRRPSKMFDLATDEGLASVRSAVGPLVFRRNKAEIAAELPQMTPKMVQLWPTPAEAELAHAATAELRRIYNELLAMLRLVEQTDPDDARLPAVKANLASARKALQPGTTLARMAASDPRALTTSKAGVAELLRASGQIDAAIADGGTKRDWLLERAKAHASAGEQMLVFTEFSTVANALVSDLLDAGLRAAAMTGKQAVSMRDAAKASFTDGDLDVLVTTSVGKRGLNLQTAAVIVHYDLPWLPSDVVQRTARVERIGSTSATLDVWFPVMRGTIEERIVALLAARSAESVRALDSSRGADAEDTDMGRLLGTLIDGVERTQLNDKQLTLLDVTAALLAP